MEDLNSLERHNLEEINGLNQRGGRMLSIVDLLEDGTLNTEMAGLMLLFKWVYFHLSPEKSLEENNLNRECRAEVVSL